jgi:hypothetical protein
MRVKSPSQIAQVNKVLCFGNGDYGELGDGKGQSSLVPVEVQGNRHTQ